MKKIILFVAVLFGVWGYYQKEFLHRPSNETGQGVLVGESRKIVQRETALATSQFKCDGRQYCGQMTSRAEAEFFIRNCLDTKMDGDNDGIPCENDSRF